MRRLSTALAMALFLSLSLAAAAGAADLDIRRVELYFENHRAEITVERNRPGLQASADIKYAGAGLLEGHWEVDGAVFARVSRLLPGGGVETIRTPDAPPLPASNPGTHTVRLVVERPGTVIPLPAMIYYVTPEDYKWLMDITLMSPADNAGLAYAPAEFVWSSPGETYVFLVQFFDKPDAKPVFSAYAVKGAYLPPEQAFKDVFARGGKYLWKVTGFDSGSNVVGQSPVWTFSY